MKLYHHSETKSYRQFQRDVESSNSVKELSDTVAELLETIRTGGNKALRELTLKFDGVKLPGSGPRLDLEVIQGSGNSLGAEQRTALREAIDSVRDYHRRTLPENWTDRNVHGGRVGERYHPIQRVGIYIPGGQVPLVSSVVMSVVPALVAKVPEIAVFTPPSAANPGGMPDKALLGALDLCGVKEVYTLGGVQAIGAAAFGTSTISPVDKIFGPGNAYVNEAKRQVFGRIGVDSQPGPSEVMVIADEGADPAFVAADLLAQAEHGTGKEKIFLVTFSERMVEAVEAAIAFQVPQLSHAKAIQAVLDNHFFTVLVESLDEAIEVANWVAPEHLELQVTKKDLPLLTREITTAGAILQGYYTPTVVGDFVAGPSHTLPTGRTGRFFSGLRAVDFLRRTSVIEYSKKALQSARESVGIFSALEHLDAHGRSLEIRLEKDSTPKGNHGDKS